MLIVVLGSPESWYLRDLARAAAARHEVVPAAFSRISSLVQPSEVTAASEQIDLARADCVLVRTMPPGSLEQVVFRMDVLARLEARGVCVLNPPRAIEVAVDKYLATARLQAAGLLVPKTIACQTTDDALAAFEQLGGDVVVKPLFGAEGRGITRLNDEALARRAFTMLTQLGAVIYMQPFIEHEGCDYRLLVIGRRVLGMRRTNDRDWRTNLSRGARAEPLEVTPELARLALAAADAVGAPLAGVDLLPGRDGKLYAIEVNAVPGWQGLSRALKVDVAALVLEYIEQQLAARRGAGGDSLRA